MLSINSYLISSVNNNYKFIFFGLILISYFAWMDIGLFIHLQRYQPPPITNSPSKISLTLNNAVQIKEPNQSYILSSSFQKELKKKQTKLLNELKFESPTVFKPLSVKLIMIDHMTHYVHDIFGRFLDDILHFTDIFPWVTPNFVSFVGLFSALAGSRLIISDNLNYMRLGAFLFELRNLADSIDGAVYRSRLRKDKLAQQKEYLKEAFVTMPSSSKPILSNNINNTNINNLLLNTQPVVYASNYGSIGYNVDVICDGLGGCFFVIALFIKFMKHLPHKSKFNLILVKFKFLDKNDKNLNLRKLFTKLEKSRFLDEQADLNIKNKLDEID